MIIKFNKFPKVFYSLLHYLRRILRNNNIEISPISIIYRKINIHK